MARTCHIREEWYAILARGTRTCHTRAQGARGWQLSGVSGYSTAYFTCFTTTRKHSRRGCSAGGRATAPSSRRGRRQHGCLLFHTELGGRGACIFSAQALLRRRSRLIVGRYDSDDADADLQWA
eukprot:2257985-Prymnesium_polylepis.1